MPVYTDQKITCNDNLPIDDCIPQLEDLATLSRYPSIEIGLLSKGQSRKSIVHDANGSEKDFESANGKPRVFRIASMMKLFINLVWCIVANPDGTEHPNLTMKAMLAYYGHSEELHRSMPKPTADPAIEELLLHLSSFTCINRYLLGLDGTCMFSKFENLLKLAIRVSKWKKEAKAYFYSSFNHILAAQLLEQELKMPFSQILKEYLFRPFGMKYSTVEKDVLEDWRNLGEVLIANGHDISPDMREVFTITEEHRYMDNTIGQAFLGGWSCVEDVMRLFAQVFRAYHGTPNLPISPNAANRFFNLPYSQMGDREREHHSLAGIKVALESDRSAAESSESYKTKDNEPLYRLEKYIKQNQRAFLFYKGALMTGFSGTLYMEPFKELCLIVMGNASGPVDATSHAAHIVLQEFLGLIGPDPQPNIPKIIRERLYTLQETFLDVEREDSDAAGWQSAGFDRFVGLYHETELNLWIEITAEKQILFKSLDAVAGPFKARTLDDKLHVCPQGQRFIIDRQDAWRDVTFHLKMDKGKMCLLGKKDLERYEKVK